MAAYGVTPAGFVVPPLTYILSSIQGSILATVDPQLDLSPTTPDGQISGIYATYAAGLWELGQVIYNAFNRNDVEGAGMDNLGDVTGTPREGPNYSQVYCTLAIAAGTYAASTWDPMSPTGALLSGVLVANVAGATAQQFANVSPVVVASLAGTAGVTSGSAVVAFTSAQTLAVGSLLIFASQPAAVYVVSATIVGATSCILTVPYTGTTAAATAATPSTIVLMQAATIGPTPTVNDGTVTAITSPVSGWLSVNNPPLGNAPNSSQSQAGAAEETDAAYSLRQSQDVSGQGGDTASSLAAQLNELGAAQVPPIALVATVLENKTNSLQTMNGLTLPPHSFAPVVYAPETTWQTTTAGGQAIAAVIYKNKPPGISSYGSLTVGVPDVFLGEQYVSYTVPTGVPLFISCAVVARAGVIFADLKSAIQAALVAAAVAPTPANGDPLPGQLAPGAPVVGAQLIAVILSVPGVFDVQGLTFGFSVAPSNTSPLAPTASQVATIAASTVSVNVQIIPGTYP